MIKYTSVRVHNNSNYNTTDHITSKGLVWLHSYTIMLSSADSDQRSRLWGRNKSVFTAIMYYTWVRVLKDLASVLHCSDQPKDNANLL